MTKTHKTRGIVKNSNQFNSADQHQSPLRVNFPQTQKIQMNTALYSLVHLEIYFLMQAVQNLT